MGGSGGVTKTLVPHQLRFLSSVFDFGPIRSEKGEKNLSGSLDLRFAAMI